MTVRTGTKRLLIVASAAYATVAGCASYLAFTGGRAADAPSNIPLQQLSDKQLMAMYHAATAAGQTAALHTAEAFAAIYVGLLIAVFAIGWVINGYRTVG